MHIKVKGRKYPRPVKPGWLPYPMHTFWHKNGNIKALLPYVTHQLSWGVGYAHKDVLNPKRMVFPPRAVDGFQSHYWPGGGTLVYVAKDCEFLCAKCAFEQVTKRGLDWPRIVAAQAYDEGPTEQCSNCNKAIESSYGDPEADKETEDA
jgi:hypothetical protein